MQQDKEIDARTRRWMSQVRTILRMRLELLGKDIGAEKMRLTNQAIDELTPDQLNKLRNVTDGIADKILAEYASKK